MRALILNGALVCAVASLCATGTNAIIEDVSDPGQQTTIKGYVNLVKPAISSLCNFASQDGVASEECKACTDSLKLLIDHLFEQRTWAIMSKCTYNVFTSILGIFYLNCSNV